MKSYLKRLFTLPLAVLFLSACDSGSSTSTIDVGVSEPLIVTGPTISGVAAIGAALDGAVVEMIDASGNQIDVGDVLTGSDGSYQVTLPGNVELPVIVRVTPPGGEPLLNIVSPSGEGDTEVVANVNPITNLVSNEVLEGADANSNSALAGALALVDPGMIEASGNSIVTSLLGTNVSYSSFSTDEAFVAKSAGNNTPPSATDAILDTIARQAVAHGSSVSEQLFALNAAENPPRLLEQPDFQVSLVSEMVKGGTSAEDLEEKLSNLGAISSESATQDDVFRAVIETVPQVIETVRSNAQGLAGNNDLLEVATDAAVSLLATTLREKKAQLNTDNDGLVRALNSSALEQTVTKVVQNSIVPTLMNFVSLDASEDVIEGLNAVANQVTQQAAIVTTSIQFTESSADVSDLISSFVAQRIVPVTSVEDLTVATSQGGQVIDDLGDINDVQTSIQNFANENADLIEGSVDDLVETIPAGTWGLSRWGGFNWG